MNSPRPRLPAVVSRLALEPLEARETPATFSNAGATLTINLTNAGEAVSLSTTGAAITVASNFTGAGAATGVSIGGTTATVTSATYTTINIVDGAADTSVAFAASTGAYTQANFGVALDDAAGGNIAFTGDSQFNGSLTASTTNGTISSVASSDLSFGGNLSLTANTSSLRDVLLAGSVAVTGTTTLNGLAVQAENAANNFTGAVSVTSGRVASIVDVNALVLGASNFGQITPSQPTTRVTAGGNITQTGAILSTANLLDVRSTGGGVTLNSAGNDIDRLALSVAGANTATAFSLTGLTVGDVTAETGLVTLITTAGALNQISGTAIRTGGPLTVNAFAGAVNVTLDQANRVLGAVTVAETGGDLQNVNFRNVADNAVFPTIPALGTAGDIGTLTLTFDNNGIVVPAISSTNAAFTAGGDITQTGPLALTGTLSAAVQGDFGIALTNAGNAVTGNVSVDAGDSTQPVGISVAGALKLDDSFLGRGAFSATATGNISAPGRLVQRKGAAPAAFASGGTSVSLSDSANDFTGAVAVTGAGVNSVNFVNSDAQARFSQLTFPATVTTLSYVSPNAAVLLPTLPLLAGLTVAGAGVFQQAGAALAVSGNAFFDAGNNRLTLNGANDFGALFVSNSGHNDVVVNDINALQFIDSFIGEGRLSVTAGGNITQQAGTAITQQGFRGPYGAISFASTGGSVTLGQNNVLFGRVNGSVAGANTFTLNTTNGSGGVLTLGNITTGAGALSVTANTDMGQYPGSKLTLGGASSFTATSSHAVTLDNKGNAFGGPVGLTAGSAFLTAAGAVALAAGAVTGALTVATGGAAAHSVTQTGALTGNGTATFRAGAGDIALTNPANNFSQVRLNSTGAAVAVTDTNALAVGPSRLGAGTLAVTAGGNITSSAGAVVQTTGAGAVTLTTPAGNNVTLNNGGNLFRGAVTVVHSKDVNLSSAGDVKYAPASVVTGSLVATAGKDITLPSDLSQLDALTLSGFNSTIASDVTLSGGTLDITGTATFVGNRAVTITGAGSANFRNAVTAGGSLTFTLPAGKTIQHFSNVWNQGANDLTINGAGAQLKLGGGRERFVMTGGAINMPGGGDITVFANGAIQVGANAAAPETVTINNGAGAVDFRANAALQVGLGAANDQLIVNGFGPLDVDGALLRTTGLAAAAPTAVLTSQTAVITGRFANSADAGGAPTDLFTGSDIVTPAYTVTQLLLKSGGTASATGTATGFLPDGDAYTVKSSLGAAAGLATLVDSAGRLNAVVRGASPAAQTLTISTAGGGDGVLPVAGVMVHGTGATTVTAAAADFTGLLTTAGPLASLTARDLGTTGLLLLNAGGPAAGSNKLTGRLFSNVVANFAGALTNFTVVAATNTNARVTADKFGALKTTGSLALGVAGDFFGNLTSTSAGVGQVLTSAAIAGAVTGTWDLGGTVGTVKTAKVNSWTLGVEPSSVARNGGLLTNIAKLDLGDVTTSLTVNATGTIAALTAAEIVGSGNVIRAGALGAMSVTGNAALGLAGNLTDTIFFLAGNAGGAKSQALASLTVAGDINGVTLTADNGNVGAVKTSRSLINSTFNVADTGTLGTVGSVTASRVSNFTLKARALTTMSVVPNLGAGLLGDVSGAAITVTGNVAGVGVGTVSAAGNVTGGDVTSSGGSVTKVSSARTMSSSTVTVSDPAFGKLGTLQAAEMSGVTATARTIDLIKTTGAKAAGPASQLIVGDFAGGGILAYDETGTVAALKTLSTAGALDGSTVQAERGLTTLAVGRALDTSVVVADAALAGNAAVGRINAVTAGAVTASKVIANTLGTVKAVGYATPELTPGSRVFGDIESSTVQANGATPTKPVGIGSFTVERHLINSTVTAPGGVTTLTAGGRIDGSTVAVENAAAPAAGFLTTLTAGGLDAATIRAGTGGAWKVTGSPKFFLRGDVLGGSTLAVLSAATPATKALGSLTAAGDFRDSTFDAPAAVGPVTVSGQVRSPNLVTQISAGYAAGAKLEKLTVGTWGGAADFNPVRLTSQSVGAVSVVGNAARGLTGFVRNGYFDILGNSANVGLGTFTASGAVTDSTFRVSDGDVTSFKALRFDGSDLLVGFRPVKNNNLLAAPVAGNWAATNRKIGLFQTTAPFNVADPDNSASFRDSNVVAAILGTVTLSGVDPTDTDTTAFGVGFRAAAGAAAKGTVKINGSATALLVDFADDQFNYADLAG